MSIETWEQRKAAGVAFFDRQIGKGWQDRVDLDRLDMSDGCYCIAGQVFGGYETAEDTARMVQGISDDAWIKAGDHGEPPWQRWGVECGFIEDPEFDYERLKQLWSDYLRDAQTVGALAGGA